MNGKVHVLLIWWYTRKDLIAPFLKMTDSLTFTFLYFPGEKEEGLADIPPFKRIYWNSFNTPSEILDDVKPDIMIVMGLDSAKPIALRMAAKRRKIPCFFVEHGIRDIYFPNFDVKDDVNVKNAELFFKRIWRKGKEVARSVYFVSAGLRKEKLSTRVKLYKMMYDFMRYSIDKTVYKNKFPERTSDIYFLLGEFQYNYYAEMDGISMAPVKVVGNIFFDDFFKQYRVVKHTPALIEDSYFLLIDQPLPELNFEQRFELYGKLYHKLKAAGKRLVIKLHPADFNHPKISYYQEQLTDSFIVKDADIVNLVFYSVGCFGFYSTLLLPIIYFKPTYIFNFYKYPIVDDWIAMQVVQPIQSLNLDDLDISGAVSGEPLIKREAYLKKYLFHIDGDCTDYLKHSIIKYTEEMTGKRFIQAPEAMAEI